MRREDAAVRTPIPESAFTLVICEKPDAARRVADALAESGIQTLEVAGVPAFSFSRGGEKFVVCSALGHLYAVSDPFAERAVYPVFDVEWFPHNLLSKRAEHARKRIESIRKLSANAKKFVNACDYDIEGETIGYNLLRYACGGKETRASRAKFSTLTKEELRDAFGKAETPANSNLAQAGRTRHVIDFLWGINLTRALSESVMTAKNRYRTISVGRVQGPALAYVVEREKEIREFVASPYWVVSGTFERKGDRFEAKYVKERMERKADAEGVQRECEDREGVVSQVVRSNFLQSRPPPFNVGDLQKEAYRVFGYSPSRTLQIAERLYLGALISYPRTSSQKLPPSLDCKKILENLGSFPDYSRDTQELLRVPLVPKEGHKSDSAHPAIYPTGERPRRPLEVWEARLFDLIVRRFLGAFSKDALREKVVVSILVGTHEFRIVGTRTVVEGWLKVYGKYGGPEDRPVPGFTEGDVLKVLAIQYEEKFDARPSRYNQGSLLERMERENLGTKATRAEIISTLVNRGYVAGEGLVATDLGFTVFETMEKHSPAVISTKLTRETEERLERIEEGREDPSGLIVQTIQTISEQLLMLKPRETEIGAEMERSMPAVQSAQNTLGSCQVCKTGKLIIIRSKKTGKRFVGCTNYVGGCRASAPLPQKGTIRTTQRACSHCGWPVVYVRLGGAPWRLCVNVNCPSKVKRRHEVSTVPKAK